MLKSAGCICVLLASTGMAYSYICGLRQELRQMEQLLELFIVLEGEITYSRCPLPELLLQLSGHMPEPYHSLLVRSSRRMEDNREADIPALWRDVCGEFRSQLAVPGEVYQILLRTGEAFAYASLDSSLQLLRMSQKKMAAWIEQKRGEFAGRRKLYCCLCYMAGLFSVILLL